LCFSWVHTLWARTGVSVITVPTSIPYATISAQYKYNYIYNKLTINTKWNVQLLKQEPTWASGSSNELHNTYIQNCIWCFNTIGCHRNNTNEIISKLLITQANMIHNQEMKSNARSSSSWSSIPCFILIFCNVTPGVK